MNRFAETLRLTSARLDLPQPARSRVLLEIAGDMEDLYEAYRASGLDEALARDQVIEKIDLSDESLVGLSAVHSGMIRRLLDRLSQGALARWEYTLLTLVVLLVLVGGLSLTGSSRIFRDAGLFIYPVLAVGLMVAALALSKFYQLYLKQDHDFRRAGRGMGLLLGGVACLPLLGFSGTWYKAIRLSGGNVGEVRPLAAVAVEWGIQTTALLQISLSLAVLGALAWFILAGKVGRIEREEAAILFES